MSFFMADSVALEMPFMFTDMITEETADWVYDVLETNLAFSRDNHTIHV